jgi:hypothetical protein
MGHRQLLQRVPDAMSGDLEMSRPFRLCPIGMGFHVTAQCFPIQFMGPLWTGTLVRHAAGLEPAIDAGLTDLEPPSRLGLAAPAPYKIHYPLAHIY